MAETDTVVARPWVCQYDGCPAGPNDPPCDCNGCVGARLQAENEALRRERDEAREVYTVMSEEFRAAALCEAVQAAVGDHLPTLTARIEQAEAAREAAEAKAARLEEALEPFANACGELFNDWCPDETPAWWSDDEPSTLAVGDFRKARAALGGDHG